jgi:glycosyltransferase involved in cell wall biosynthesis
MATRGKVPWVAEYRDNWTTNPLYRRRFPRRVLERRLERATIRRASAIIAMSEPAARELREGLGLDPERVLVAANGFDPDDLPAPGARAEHFEIAYLGALDERRDPRTFFRALAERSASDPRFGTDLTVRLVGNVSSWAADVARSALGQDRVRLDGLVSHREALSIGARAAVLLGITTESEAGAAGLTSKVFDYLGLRRPILMLAPPSPAKVLVESLQAGQTAPPTDIEAIRIAIGRLYDDWRAGTEVVVTLDALSAHTRLETARSVAAALDFAISRKGSSTARTG